MGYIEEEKFVGTLVVDSEGYICGRVASFEITPDRVLMRLYKEVGEEKEVVDVEKLKEALMMFLFNKVSPKHEKKLYKKLRKELKLPSEMPITEEELVSFARMLGLDIPTKKVHSASRVNVDEPVDMELIEQVNESPLGKAVILKEPWEAKRRGVPIVEGVPYKSTEEIKGKLVLDSTARIIGHAQKILIGRPLGLRVALETYREEEEVDFEALMEMLFANFKNPKALFKQVAKDLGIKPDQVTRDHILSWAEMAGIEIPKKKVRKLVTKNILDLPWTAIRKIGDVILLNKSLEELLSGEALVRYAEESSA